MTSIFSITVDFDFDVYPYLFRRRLLLLFLRRITLRLSLVRIPLRRLLRLPVHSLIRLLKMLIVFRIRLHTLILTRVLVRLLIIEGFTSTSTVFMR